MNVIFDLDGTLADSAVLTVEAVKRVAPEFGLEVPSNEVIRKTIGFANPEFYDRLFPGFPTETVRRAGEMIELEELGILSSMEGRDLLFAGCLELLEELRGHGYSLTIASTGSHEHVYAVLNAAKINTFFSDVYCDRPDKTDMLKAIIKGRPKDFVMVGDMRKDSDAARANAILSVGACYGYCIREKSDFDCYIEAPLELLNILHKNFK